MNLEFLDFSYVDVRKNGLSLPQNVKTNINILSMTRDKDRMNIGFEYLATYDPDNSSIRIGGTATFSGTEVKTVYDEWTLHKRVSGATGSQIINTINYSASMNAILMSRAMNMSPPVLLPTIRLEEPVKKKK